uniref:Uncharacterized protein n=1 Tax=Arion vulgaris TaxID=1028688 RepID=A0A0B7AES6_9EUPU
MLMILVHWLKHTFYSASQVPSHSCALLIKNSFKPGVDAAVAIALFLSNI